MNNIDQDCCVFISENGKRYINTYRGSPCFARSSHDRILKIKGFDKSVMCNFTITFNFEGKGRSIKQFLND